MLMQPFVRNLQIKTDYKESLCRWLALYQIEVSSFLGLNNPKCIASA